MKTVLYYLSVALIFITAIVSSIYIIIIKSLSIIFIVSLVSTIGIVMAYIIIKIIDIFDKIDKDIKKYLLESESKTLEVDNPYRSTNNDQFLDQKY